MYSAEKYEILYTQKEPKWQDVARRDVSMQRTQVWRCGDMLEIRSFPIWSTKTQKAAAEQAMREKRDRSIINARMREKQKRDRFRRILEANFSEKDLMITLTYDYGQVDYAAVDKAEMERELAKLPQDETEARKDVQAYVRRLRRWMQRNGRDPAQLKYIYVTETGKEQRDGERLPWSVRFHHHVILSGVPREAAEELWTAGFANSRRLQPNEAGLAQLAAYLTKQKRFSHSWARSKNLITPQPEVSDRAISRRRVARIAADVARDGRAILQQIYPGYAAAEEPQVRFSDFTTGVYIYARMRRLNAWNKGGTSRCRSKTR